MQPNYWHYRQPGGLGLAHEIYQFGQLLIENVTDCTTDHVFYAIKNGYKKTAELKVYVRFDFLCLLLQDFQSEFNRLQVSAKSQYRQSQEDLTINFR